MENLICKNLVAIVVSAIGMKITRQFSELNNARMRASVVPTGAVRAWALHFEVETCKSPTTNNNSGSMWYYK